MHLMDCVRVNINQRPERSQRVDRGECVQEPTLLIGRERTVVFPHAEIAAVFVAGLWWLAVIFPRLETRVLDWMRDIAGRFFRRVAPVDPRIRVAWVWRRHVAVVGRVAIVRVVAQLPVRSMTVRLTISSVFVRRLVGWLVTLSAWHG